MHFIFLFSLMISLISSAKARDDEELDQMGWDDVYQLALASENGPQSTEEFVSMLDYLDKRPHDNADQKNVVKNYLEFSKISQSRCYSGFFRYLKESIVYASQYGSRRMSDYLIEMEKNQFNACKDEWTRDILSAKGELDPITLENAERFLDSFNVQPIPYPKQYFSPDAEQLEHNLIYGALFFVESQRGKPLKSKRFWGNSNKVRIEKKYDKLVKQLCERVEDKLKLKTDVFMNLYKSYDLIPSIAREALDWIQIEGICRFALERGINKLAGDAYSIVVQREA